MYRIFRRNAIEESTQAKKAALFICTDKRCSRTNTLYGYHAGRDPREYDYRRIRQIIGEFEGKSYAYIQTSSTQCDFNTLKLESTHVFILRQFATFSVFSVL